MAPHSPLPRSWLVILIVCCLTASGTAAAAQDRGLEKAVEVTGTSPFSESDPSGMRENALRRALEDAVLEVAAEVVGQDVFAADSRAIRDALSEDTQRYIDTYRVLEESRTDQTYQVKVQVTVSPKLIDGELRRRGILRSAERLPKVLFLTSQQNLGDEVPRFWWSGTAQDSEFVAENAMIKALSENGFDVIGRHAPGVGAAVAPQRLTPDPEAGEAADMGLRAGADVVVTGQSAAQAPSGVGAQGPRTFTATATLRALGIPSGELLAETSDNFVTVDTDDRTGGLKALAGAGERAGLNLAALLRPAWLNLAKRGSLLRLEVEGTRALADFVRFRNILKTTDGVQAIRIESLQADRAVIAVEGDANPQALAARLSANRYPSFGVDIYEVSRQGLKLRIIRTGDIDRSQRGGQP